MHLAEIISEPRSRRYHLEAYSIQKPRESASIFTPLFNHSVSDFIAARPVASSGRLYERLDSFFCQAASGSGCRKVPAVLCTTRRDTT